MSDQKAVLVTGGAGFIGSHLCRSLVKLGYKVRVLDNLSSGHLQRLSDLGAWGAEIEFIEGDIRDAKVCRKAAQGIYGIFHQAALVSVFDSIKNPKLNHSINIDGTFNLLEAAQFEDVQKFVFASSAAVYGDSTGFPKHEAMLPDPKSPYAVAKIAGEHYMKSYANLCGLQCVALRYFNVYGAGQDASSMYSGVISRFIDHVSTGTLPTIFGDGLQSRDFVHVSDVVEANILSMSQTLPSAFTVCNVATGRESTLLELLDAISVSSGVKLEPRFEAARAGDIKRSLASIRNAQSILGYQPKVLDLKVGLETML